MMTHHLFHLLAHWYPRCDACNWVLVTVVRVRGSNYRKPGAMMLISEFGETLGLISGGCLEKSLLNSVKKVLSLGQPLWVEIDSSDEGNLASLGCGGQVSLWLQPVTKETAYQSLDQLFLALSYREQTQYGIQLSSPQHNYLVSLKSGISDKGDLLLVTAKPPIHLGIFGAGLDVIPLAAMAELMGWQVTLIENRVGFGLTKDFPKSTILRASADSPEMKSLVKALDAAVVMTHNLSLDAAALQQVQAVDYVGLLGPTHRREKVFALAGLENNPNIHGPMGLNLGGDLPESIALSVLAEIHQVLAIRDRSSAQLIER